MKVVSLLAQKGGVGKSTLTLNLAVAAAKDHKVVTYDFDSQGSLTEWAEMRKERYGITEKPNVINRQAVELEELIGVCREEGVEYLFIDTMPRIEKDAVDATRFSDLVVIPSRTGSFDLKAIATSAQIANAQGVESLVVINAGRPGAGPTGAAINLEAIRLLQNAGYKVADKPIMQRVAFQDTQATGDSVYSVDRKSRDAKAMREIDNLWRTIQTQLGEAA